MDEFKNTSIWELLRMLQDKVKNNITKIQKNLDKVQLIKHNYTSSIKRDRIINVFYQRNNELTKENTSFLELHNTLYGFVNDNKELIKSKIKTEPDKTKADKEVWKNYRNTCMLQTVSGELKLQEGHPFMRDQVFMDDLMAYCQRFELYEKCSEIVRVRELEKTSKA